MGKQRRPGSIKQPDKKKGNKKNGRLHTIPHAVDPDTGRVRFLSQYQGYQPLQQHQGYDPLWGSDFQYR